MRKAGIFVRFLAFAIDLILLCFLAGFLLLATAAGFVASGETLSGSGIMELTFIFLFSFLCVMLFYFTYLTMDGAATVGKKIFKLKVVGKDGEDIGFLRAFVRSMAYPVSVILWMISLILVFLFRGKALHDMIAGTQVVEEEG